MVVKVFDNYEMMSAEAAQQIIETVQANPAALLCFATGNTPVRTYELLAQKARMAQTDFSRCCCIGLDEWIGVPKDKPGTCHYLLYKQVFDPLGIRPSQVHIFDGMASDIQAACKKMNDIINERGGVDCMVVGIGLNGHIGFNEPGADIMSGAHEQLLQESTLASGQHYFNEPTAISKGITLGMAQVLQAKKLLVLANGRHKASIIRQAVKGHTTSDVPASYVQQCKGALILLDKEAAAEL